MVLYAKLSLTVDSLRDRSLTGQAEDIASHIHPAPDGTLSLGLPDELARAYGRADGEYLFQVRDAGGALLFASAGKAPALDQIRPEASDEAQFFLIEGPSTPKIYAARIVAQGPAGPLFIRVGQGISHDDVLVDELLVEFFEDIGWVMIPILALLLLVNIMTLRRGLAPIAQASAQASAIGPERPGLRLPETDMPDEIRPLVHAVNAALDRLEEGFQRQRAFTADAAHELRTPLAVLTANLDTLEERAAAEALRGDVAAIERIVEQLLRVANMDSLSIGPDERTDLAILARDVASYMMPLALRAGKSLAVDVAVEPVMVAGNREALFHALRNLVENAIAHTPNGTTVEVAVSSDGELRVTDSGPGVPPEQRELVFRRFWRGERSGKRSGGAGLGLSIVSRTVEAHGGSVAVDEAPGGGARFSLKLPLAEAAG